MTALFECINYLLAYQDETNQHLQIQLMKHQHMIDYFEAPEFEMAFKPMSVLYPQ